MQSLETAIGLSTNFPTKASNYSQTKRKKNHQKITKRPTTVPIQTIPRQIERIEEMNWLGFAEFWTPSSLLLSSLEFCWMWWFPCKSGFFFPYFHPKRESKTKLSSNYKKSRTYRRLWNPVYETVTRPGFVLVHLRVCFVMHVLTLFFFPRVRNFSRVWLLLWFA